jgi:16S rRNA (uracil1498-N3)-methyltransferase
MPRPDFRTPRLFLESPLAAGATVALDRSQANYLGNVLRLGTNDEVLVFNGRDGEWRAAISGSRRADALAIQAQTRPQQAAADISYVFAPLKHARLDYMAQKAVEMGASRLMPVSTRHTQVSRVNTDRMRANVIEAAEQCGILTIAPVDEPVTLQGFLDQRNPDRLLVFCDEDADMADPIAALNRQTGAVKHGIDVLIGPEGGFAPEERDSLLRQPHLVRLSLGPRILRADTAAVAALALVQAALAEHVASEQSQPDNAN